MNEYKFILLMFVLCVLVDLTDKLNTSENKVKSQQKTIDVLKQILDEILKKDTAEIVPCIYMFPTVN